MVKFRGIDVSIVSQFDIRKLPEFSPCESNDPSQQAGPTLRSGDRSVASYYVPIYPGSQIWFQYSVDAPYPPDASYFFKMLHNGQVVTSWDCTSKHGYHGNMTYNIRYVGNDNLTGAALVQRQVLKFTPAEPRKDVGPFDDCIEIRIHRIEHRQRMPLGSSNAVIQLPENSQSTGLCLVNGGLLEPGCPQCRYRYRLLDPVDEPYATIRFFYRTYGFLEKQNIIPSSLKPSRSTSASSSRDWSEQSVSITHEGIAGLPAADHTQHDAPNIAPTPITTPPPTCNFQIVNENPQRLIPKPQKKTLSDQVSPPRIYDDSLRIMAKDSLEDLHASPLNFTHDSPFPVRDDVKIGLKEDSALTSSKKLQKKPLTLEINGANFELEKKKRPPMSPFTSAGVLRRMMSPIPPSAPATVTEFGPTVAQEVETQLGQEEEHRKLEKAQLGKIRTTRAERGGNMLLGFLGRILGKAEYVNNTVAG